MFPELMNKTVTLYNAYIVNEQVTWHRRVLKNVFLNNNRQYIQSKTGAIIDTVSLLIISDTEDYISPVEWTRLPNDKMHTRWTVGASERDFYVVGEVFDDIPPYTERQIKATYENYTIKTSDTKPDFNGGIHRIVVTGV